jgi:hypothetical protein
MKTGNHATRTAPAILPLAMILVPKCPLCLLPLLAVAGAALPPAPLLNGILGAAAIAWLALLTNMTRSAAARALALSGVVLLLCGRWLEAPAASWAGVLLMVAVVIRASARDCASESAVIPMSGCAQTPGAPRA